MTIDRKYKRRARGSGARRQTGDGGHQVRIGAVVKAIAGNWLSALARGSARPGTSAAAGAATGCHAAACPEAPAGLGAPAGSDASAKPCAPSLHPAASNGSTGRDVAACPEISPANATDFLGAAAAWNRDAAASSCRPSATPRSARRTATVGSASPAARRSAASVGRDNESQPEQQGSGTHNEGWIPETRERCKHVALGPSASCPGPAVALPPLPAGFKVVVIHPLALHRRKIMLTIHKEE